MFYILLWKYEMSLFDKIESEYRKCMADAGGPDGSGWKCAASTVELTVFRHADGRWRYCDARERTPAWVEAGADYKEIIRRSPEQTTDVL